MTSFMRFVREHKKLSVTAGAALVLAAGAVGGLYYARVRYFTPERMSAIITARIKKHLARDFSFRAVRLTRAHGLEFEGVALNENSRRSGGDFLRAGSVMIDTNLRALLAGRAEFDRLTVTDGSLLIKRTDRGVWNFDDILALRDPDKTGRPVTEMVIANGLLQYEDGLDGTRLIFTNVNGIYRYGGSDYMRLEARADGLFRGAQISGGVSVICTVNFKGGRFSGSDGAVKVSGLVSGAMEASQLDLDWKLRDFEGPLYKRGIDAAFYAGGVTLKGLGRAGYGEWTYWLAMPFKTLSSLQGASVPDLNAFKVDSLKTRFRQRARQWETMEFAAAGPDLKLDFEGCVDPGRKEGDFKLDMKAGSAGLELAVWGPLDNPEFKPEVSSTVGSVLRDSLRSLRMFLDTRYPVSTAD
ncbi:MAG: hypothetical protein PHW69_01540 [Elusimicrobiaceae bacterium]|nr:hypothetical protein [Elusimicrobiaceae bacterium]